MENQRKLCIVGAGGFGREVMSSFKESYLLLGKKIENEVVFLDDDPKLKGKKIIGIPVIQSSDFIPSDYEVVVAIGEPSTRKKIIEKLPKETNYTTLVHPTAIIMDDCEIGAGSIITAGCIITTNIKIGKHSHLNLHTTIGHDCEIGNYFTTAPGTHISGECKIGNCVYFGTNSSIRQGITVCNETTIGMGGVVVKNLIKSGIYIGNPLKKLVK